MASWQCKLRCLKAPDVAAKRMKCLFISVMGFLYRDIVIHISEGRDDIIKLALVVEKNTLIDKTLKLSIDS